MATKTGLKMEVSATSGLFAAASSLLTRALSSLTARENTVYSRRSVEGAMGRAQEEGSGRAQGKRNLGAMGTTRFKSRSFEAWHKAGGVHLFPVDPNTTPYEERPYMQRKDGTGRAPT